MAEHSETVARIAREIMARAEREGWTGETGDAAATAAAMEALAGARITHGERHSLVLDLAEFARRTDLAGLAYVEHQADPAHPWGKLATEREGFVDEGYFDHDWYN